jgi:hypothetical protein
MRGTRICGPFPSDGKGARQMIHLDFIGRGFPAVLRRGKLEIAVNFSGIWWTHWEAMEIQWVGKSFFLSDGRNNWNPILTFGDGYRHTAYAFWH